MTLPEGPTMTAAPDFAMSRLARNCVRRSIILGQIFDHAGWLATVAPLAVALVGACGLASLLTEQRGDSAAISES